MSLDSIAEYYDEQAKTYDKGFEQFYWKVSDAITWVYLERYLPKNPDSVILDAAGGTGRWAIPIAKKGYNVVVVDLSQGMLDVAKEKIQKEGLENRITLIREDVTKLDYPDESFDFVLCLTDALPLAEDIEKTLQELRRVMKEDSCIVADLINRFGLLMPQVSGDPYDATKVEALVERLKSEESIPGKSSKDKKFRWMWHFPQDATRLFERNNLRVEKIVGKPITLLWRDPLSAMGKKDLQPTQRLLDSIIKLELALCEEPTLLGMAAKFMIVAKKTVKPS